MANPNSLLHFNALKNPNGVGALEEARPFKCPVCLRTFKKKCGLKSHEASFHVGDDLWKIMFTPFSSWENKVETKVASRGKVTRAASGLVLVHKELGLENRASADSVPRPPQTPSAAPLPRTPELPTATNGSDVVENDEKPCKALHV